MIRLLKRLKELEEIIEPKDEEYVIWVNPGDKPADYYIMVENGMMKKIHSIPKLRGEVEIKVSIYKDGPPKNVIR
jgi:hypothetical protein